MTASSLEQSLHRTFQMAVLSRWASSVAPLLTAANIWMFIQSFGSGGAKRIPLSSEKCKTKGLFFTFPVRAAGPP